MTVDMHQMDIERIHYEITDIEGLLIQCII